MPQFQPAPLGLKFLVGTIFLSGAAFGGLAAFVQNSPTAKPSGVEIARAPDPAPTTKAKEPVKVETPETKPEPKKPEVKKPEAKPTAKAPETKPEVKPEPKKNAVTFQANVLPILKTHCTMCHGDPQKKADLDLRTLASIAKGSTSGDAVVANDLKKSGIWQTIDDGTMPPAGKPKMTPSEKKVIKDWIESGAK